MNRQLDFDFLTFYNHFSIFQLQYILMISQFLKLKYSINLPSRLNKSKKWGKGILEAIRPVLTLHFLSCLVSISILNQTQKMNKIKVY